MSAVGSRVPRIWLQITAVALFGAVYYLLSELGLSLIAQPEQVAVLWPASGVALAVVTLSPRRWWPALIGTVFVSNLTAQVLSRGFQPVSFELAAVNALEPLLAAMALLLVTGRKRRFVYGSARGVVGLLTAATVANGGTALLGGTVISEAFGAPFWPAAVTWWLADGLGMLAVAPLVFAWGDRRKQKFRIEEGLLLAAVTVASLALVFPEVWGAPESFIRASALLPLLIWTAVKAQPRTASIATLIITISMTLATLNGRGPFARDFVSQVNAVESLQVFLAVAALLALMVEGVLADRRVTEYQLAATSESLGSVLRAATEFSIVGTDISGTITVFNEGAERMLGYTAKEMLGQSPEVLHDPAEIVARAEELDVEPGFEVFVHSARNEQAETRQWTYVRKDGRTLPVSLTVTARVNDEGRLAGYIGIARDISESIRVEAERAALVRASRAVAAADSLDDALELVAREVGELNKADIAAVTRFDSTRVGTVVGAWSDNGRFERGLAVDLSKDTAVGLVSRRGRISRTHAQGDFARRANATGRPQARIGVPVIADGRLWGSVSVAAKPGEALGNDVENGLLRFADLVGLAVTNMDTRTELEKKRDELSAIIDGLPALVWVRDLEGKLLLFNRDFADLIKTKGTAADTAALRSALFDGDLESAAVEAGETTRVEQTLTVAGGGGERTLLVARSPLTDSTGLVYALSCVATDITERREIERAKDEFIAVVSHELRTPLSSIRGALSLLSENDAELDAVARTRMIEIASSNSERLVALINDILDLQRIESGANTVELRASNAATLVVEAAEAMESLAAEKDIEIVASPSDAPIRVEPDRIVQVLNNFLSNAVKFSERGVRIEIGSTRIGDELAFFVRDYGRGIPADKLEVIFERFQQVDSSDARSVGGTGLGLAISRQIATQNGGRVWAESEIGIGSCFWLAVPMETRRALPAPTVTPVDDAPILICDDDPVARAEARKIVEDLGFAAVECDTGEAAAKIARTSRPTAILLDLVMPGMDGFQTLADLSEHEETAPIPVVMVSSLAPEQAEAPPAPVVDWVTKPITPERLVKALSLVLVEPEAGSVLVVEDDPGLADVLLEQLRRDMIPAAHARSGREAISLATRMKPDLIVLDVGLPSGDGFEVVEALRSRGLVPDALVVYSALEFDADDQERLRLGQTEFVTKSRVSPQHFHRRLAELSQKVRREKVSPAV